MQKVGEFVAIARFPDSHFESDNIPQDIIDNIEDSVIEALNEKIHVDTSKHRIIIETRLISESEIQSTGTVFKKDSEKI